MEKKNKKSLLENYMTYKVYTGFGIIVLTVILILLSLIFHF